MELSAIPKPNGHLWVYALALESSCYYIGCTDWPKRRILKHFSGLGAKWTRLHKPIAVVACYPGDGAEERQLTLEYKDLYGWNKVRGGCYTQCVS